MNEFQSRLVRSFDKLRRFAGEPVEIRANGVGSPISLTILDDSGITQTLQLGGVDGVARVITLNRNEYAAAVGDAVTLGTKTYHVIRVVHTGPITSQLWLSEVPTYNSV